MSTKNCPVCNVPKRSDKYYQHLATHKDELIAKSKTSDNAFCNQNKIPILHVYDNSSTLTNALCLCCKKGSDINNRRCSKPFDWMIDHAKSECKSKWSDYSKLFEVKELSNDVKTLQREIEKLRADNERLNKVINIKNGILVKYKKVIDRHDRHIRRRDKQVNQECFICKASISCDINLQGNIDYSNIDRHQRDHIKNPHDHITIDVLKHMTQTQQTVIKDSTNTYFFCVCCKEVFDPNYAGVMTTISRHKCHKNGFKELITGSASQFKDDPQSHTNTIVDSDSDVDAEPVVELSDLDKIMLSLIDQTVDNSWDSCDVKQCIRSLNLSMKDDCHVEIHHPEIYGYANENVEYEDLETLRYDNTKYTEAFWKQLPFYTFPE